MSAIAPPPNPNGEVAPPEPAPDFSRRQYELREWMDEPCTFADWEITLKHLARVNRLLGGTKPVIAFLERILQARGVRFEPLHIVDVGCGDGEMLRDILRWATQRSVPVRLTGFDMNPYAARAAAARDREQRVPPGVIAWRTADAFAAEGADVDVIVTSLFTHHLSDDEVVRFLRWQEQTARCGWMIKDLLRSKSGYRWFQLLAKVMRWHPFIQHDGAASIRRAFVREDWERMLSEAGMRDAQIVFRAQGHLCVERMKAPATIPPNA